MRAERATTNSEAATMFYTMNFDGVDRADFFVNCRLLVKKQWFSGHKQIDEDGLRAMTYEKLLILLDLFDGLTGCYGRWAEYHALVELHTVEGRTTLPSAFAPKPLKAFYIELLHKLFGRRMEHPDRRRAAAELLRGKSDDLAAAARALQPVASPDTCAGALLERRHTRNLSSDRVQPLPSAIRRARASGRHHGACKETAKPLGGGWRTDGCRMFVLNYKLCLFLPF